MQTVCYLLTGQCNPDVIILKLNNRLHILRVSLFTVYSIESLNNFFFAMEINYLLHIVLYGCNINCEGKDLTEP